MVLIGHIDDQTSGHDVTLLRMLYGPRYWLTGQTPLLLLPLFFLQFFFFSFYNKKKAHQKNSCFRCWVETLLCSLSAGCLIHCRTRAAAPVYWRQAKKTEADLHFSFIALSKVGFKSTFNLMETHLVSLLFAFPTDSFFFLTPIYYYFFFHSRLVSLSFSQTRTRSQFVCKWLDAKSETLFTQALWI